MKTLAELLLAMATVAAQMLGKGRKERNARKRVDEALRDINNIKGSN